MTNKSISEQNKQLKTSSAKPKENAGLHFSSFVKIFDPNTKQILMQKRGDI